MYREERRGQEWTEHLVCTTHLLFIVDSTFLFNRGQTDNLCITGEQIKSGYLVKVKGRFYKVTNLKCKNNGS